MKKNFRRQVAVRPCRIESLEPRMLLSGSHVAVDASPGNSAVTSADLLGNGRQDIIVANHNSNDISVLLAKRNGGFKRPVNYGDVVDPTGVVAGDFNGDGKLDLAVANYGGVSIYLGNGDGTFAPPELYPAGTDNYSLVAGDFNGDGKLDVAVATSYVIAPRSTDIIVVDVDVLFGNGNGTLQAGVLTTLANSQTASIPSLAVADLTGDGKDDLVATDPLGSGVDVLLSQGTTFATPVNYDAGDAVNSLAIADFNADHHADIALAGSHGVKLLMGNGNGTFQAPLTYTAGSAPGNLTVGDFNGDGRPDMAVINPDGRVSVWLNGPATFSVASKAARDNPVAVTAADTTGDGVGDLALINNAGLLSVLANNGAGRFRGVVYYQTGGDASMASLFATDARTANVMALVKTDAKVL